MQSFRNLIDDLLHNYVLVTAITAWFLAQLIKTVLVLIQSREFRLERFVGSGGMPSSHSASVCSLVVALAKLNGVTSPLFAIAVIFAMVVMHDAMGVRLEAGKHARIINVLLKKTDAAELSGDIVLKELVGHTTAQVLVGAALGILIGLMIPVF